MLTTSQIMPLEFGFNTQQVGLQYLSLIIGSVIGEQIGGITSDRWMLWRGKKIQRQPEPEFRLWLSYIGHVLTIVGVVVFLVQLGNIKSYNVTPVVGAAIAAAGNQIVTTVMITYAVDCYRQEASSVGVFITFVSASRYQTLTFALILFSGEADLGLYWTILVPTSHRKSRIQRDCRSCRWLDGRCVYSAYISFAMERSLNETLMLDGYVLLVESVYIRKTVQHVSM